MPEVTCWDKPSQRGDPSAAFSASEVAAAQALVPTARVFGLAANSPLSAVTNAGLIQAALNNRGRIYIDEPGTIILGDTGAFAQSLLEASSGTGIELGPNTTIKQADGISKCFLQVATIAAAVVTVTNGITCGAVVGTGFAIATADCGANAHGLAVGDPFNVKGDASRQYNGRYFVLSVLDAFRFTFMVWTKSSFTASTGTVTVRKCTTNVTIRGGTWDYNGYNNPYVTGVRAQGFLLNNVADVYFGNLTALNFTKWVTNIGNAHGVYCGDVECQTGSDGIHLCGNVTNALIEDIRGTTGDDMVALEADPVKFNPTEAIAGGDQVGDFLNVTVRAIKAQRTSEDVVAVYPQDANEVANLLIEDVQCADSCKSGVYIATSSASVVSAVRDITIRGLKLRDFSANPVKIGNGSTSFAVEKLDISGIDVGRSIGRTVAMVALTNTQIASDLCVDKVNVLYDVTSGLSQQVVQLSDSTCTVGGKLKVTNVEGATVNSGSSAKLISIAASANNYDIELEHINLAGNFHAWNNTAQTGVVRISIDFWRNNYFIVSASQTSTLVIRLGANVAQGTPGGNAPLNLTGTSKVYSISNAGADFGNATNWLACGTSSTYYIDVGKAKTQRTADVPSSTQPGISYGTTNTFLFSSTDPAFTVKTDTAGHTFTPRVGSTWNDTQAAAPGIYVRSPGGANVMVAPSAKTALNAAATDLATTTALVNQIRAMLIANNLAA